jgi:hypothetical protein
MTYNLTFQFFSLKNKEFLFIRVIFSVMALLFKWDFIIQVTIINYKPAGRLKTDWGGGEFYLTVFA